MPGDTSGQRKSALRRAADPASPKEIAMPPAAVLGELAPCAASRSRCAGTGGQDRAEHAVEHAGSIPGVAALRQVALVQEAVPIDWGIESQELLS